MKKGILSAKDLAAYIKNEYNIYSEGKKEITPIKIQKALYFCFGFWGGFVSKGKMEEFLKPDVNEFLFTDEIQAWSYGPVVPSVYFNEKNKIIFSNKEEEEKALIRVNEIFDKNNELRETINSLLHDIFEISDFKLVSLSHMDKCWQEHYIESDKQHKNPIPHQEIIDEYTTKKFA